MKNYRVRFTNHDVVAARRDLILVRVPEFDNFDELAFALIRVGGATRIFRYKDGSMDCRSEDWLTNEYNRKEGSWVFDSLRRRYGASAPVYVDVPDPWVEKSQKI